MLHFWPALCYAQEDLVKNVRPNDFVRFVGRRWGLALDLEIRLRENGVFFGGSLESDQKLAAEMDNQCCTT